MAPRAKAMTTRKKRESLWATLATHGRVQIRFLIALAVGLGVGLLAPIEDWVTRVLAGWNAGGWLYFALVATKMWHAEIEGIKREAGIERESRIAVLVIVILGSLFAMLALFTQLSVMKSEHGFDRSLSITLSLSTIFLSWMLMHLVFAVFYAHEFHGQRGGKTDASGGGLKFPGENAPDYLDFVYFSFGVGTTAQTSDVAVTSRAMRHVVMVHGVLSFFFNTAVIALAVSLAAELVQG
jgi:uncharacterized membrane protein